MNKKTIIIGVAVLLVCVGLSGCNEQGETFGDTNKVELVSYKVETYDGNTLLGEDFIHNEGADNYRIKGTIKNIAGYKLSRVTITVKFYDKNNIFLDSVDEDVYGIPDTYTESFSIRAYTGSWFNDIDEFNSVDSIKFEFTAS